MVRAILALTIAGLATAVLGGECAAGSCAARESVLLQVEAGTRKEVLELSKHAEPELPPPYMLQSGSVRTILSQQTVADFGSPSEAEMESFRLLKELRTSGFQCKSQSFAGKSDTEQTFKFDCRLWRAARLWSSKMGTEGFFSHVRGPSNPCVRTAEQGFRACWENIAAGFSSPARTMEQWKESDGHCVNMMDPRLNRFGIGYVETQTSKYKHYWTQSMGMDNQDPDQSCLANVAAAPVARRPSVMQPPATQPPVTQPPSQGQPEGKCEDTNVHCATSYSIYCDRQNVKDACPKTCGLCCEDQNPHCATSYKKYCYATHIKEACPMTCGVCSR